MVKEKLSSLPTVDDSESDIEKKVDDDCEVTNNDYLISEERKRMIEKAKSLEAPEDVASRDSRLQYLMAQSEVFSHFINEDTCSSKVKAGLGAKRKRLDEATEDRSMLQAAQSNTSFTRLVKQPSGIIGGQMRSYQLEGLNWLIKLVDSNINGILADEMGLGKTLQTISLLTYLYEYRDIPGPSLIIVPKSTCGNWQREFNRWCGFSAGLENPKVTFDPNAGNKKPALRVVKLLGTKEQRAAICREFIAPKNFDIVITSYEACVKEKAALCKINWNYLVIDEAHRIKNENSLLSKITRMLNARNKLLVTGTPLQNNLHELWSLLNFLMPEVFYDSEKFDSWFNIKDKDSADYVVQKLHTILKPFMLRRIKIDVEKDLPPKIETKLYVGMSKLQKEWYVRVLMNDIERINALGGADRVRLLNVLMQLRKVCNHPYLFDGSEPGPPYSDGPHLWENCGKMTVLHKLLAKLKEQGSRVLIFCSMTRLLDIMEDYMQYVGYTYARIDGSTSTEDRDNSMEEFNKPNSPLFCFLLSTRAGGLGINLQTADTVILYDSDWNPQVDLQAQDRAHRIGQKKTVRVFRLITDGSVEVKIVERADKKLFLDAAVIQQGRLTDMNSQLSKAEVMTMIKFGADEILKNKEGTITEEDIDILLARDEERTLKENEQLQTNLKHNLANFSLALDGEDTADVYAFEGEDFRAKRKSWATLDPEDDSAQNTLFINLPQREKKRISYSSMEDGPPVASNQSPRGTEPKPAKSKKFSYVFPDFQFFDLDGLSAIAVLENRLDKDRLTLEQLKKEMQAKAFKARKGKLEDENTDNLLEVAMSAAGVLPQSGLWELVMSSNKNLDGLFNEELKEEQFKRAVEALTNSLTSPALTLQGIAYDSNSSMFDRRSALLSNGFILISRVDYKVLLDAVEQWGLSAAVQSASKLPPNINEAVEKYLLEPQAARGVQELVEEMAVACPSHQKSYIIGYVITFCRKFRTLSDVNKVLERGDRGDKRAARSENLKTALEALVSRIRTVLINKDSKYYVKTFQNESGTKEYILPLIPAGCTGVLPYVGVFRNRLFSEEADIFLVFMLFQHGYGAWDKIRGELRGNNLTNTNLSNLSYYHQLFQFDWYLKSRNNAELQRRCDVLLRMAEKDYERRTALTMASYGSTATYEVNKRPLEEPEINGQGSAKKEKK